MYTCLIIYNHINSKYMSGKQGVLNLKSFGSFSSIENFHVMSEKVKNQSFDPFCLMSKFHIYSERCGSCLLILWRTLHLSSAMFPTL
jgi:hypothetical protein